MDRRAFLALALGASGVVISGGTSAQSKPRVTGTFSNLVYTAEGGDLLGVEIKIVPTRRGFQGALQIAEGGPSEIMVVDVRVQGEQLEFTIPESYRPYGGGSFKGKVNANGIVGRFVFNGNAQEEARLVRRPGYWDRR